MWMKLGATCLTLAFLAAPATAQKFYPDDPLEKVPPLWPTENPQTRALSSILETLNHTFGAPGERHPDRGVIPAGGVNTLGEVMDGPWFENRHARHHYSLDGLKRGPGDARPPAEGRWKVLTVKRFGFRPGMLIADTTGQIYLLRFDPKGRLEMATGAEMVSSKFFYALGYFVPENYIIYFDRERLELADGSEQITSAGGTQNLIEQDIDVFLKDVARDPKRGYRAVASRVPAAWDGLLGPYQVFGIRSDDPNDIVPHEHRRDLRGLFVFSSWLNHNRMAAVYTLDALVEQDGVPIIRHYLIDFIATLGSGESEPKKSWRGHEKTYDFGQTFKNIAGMGVYTPSWLRAKFPKSRAVGRFESATFEPDRWKPDILIAPFANRLPDDTYWAAKQVMAFTDEDIRAIVSTGQYTDPAVEAWIAKTLQERRDRIGATYFAKVLPIDDFEVENGELHFDDLAVEYGFVGVRRYTVQWSRFDNQTEKHDPIGFATEDLHTPPAAPTAADGTYFSARITAGEKDKATIVYLRKEPEGLKVVGVDREWPGKVLASAERDVDTGLSRYKDLDVAQKELFGSYTKAYNESTGFSLTPEEYFHSLTISERTTFDAVTHALIHSPLTDENGVSLGRPIDLIDGIQRIAGQYYGRGGDQQFRLYVFLKKGARSTLEKSREFHLGHLNTVYHAGYPYSFRQEGKVPNIQFSIAEDRQKADIDVDYRSSKMPAAMFNGHLTAANSDVRAGDNYERHNRRWGGFIDWWGRVFGKINDQGQDQNAAGTGLYAREPLEPATPLPPDRPFGAEPEKLEDAAQEFLTDWLVRRKVGESLHFVSERALACVSTDDDVDLEVLKNEGAIAALKKVMELSIDKLGERHNLTEAIDVVLPWRESIRVVEQPYEKDFALLELTDKDASIYLCDKEPESPTPDAYGTYYATFFRFKRVGSATLGILWNQENGHWRIRAWEAFQP